jgi:hypothetical protein
MSDDQREQALATAVERINDRVLDTSPDGLPPMRIIDDLALIRAALTPPPLPADLAVAAETAETLRTWFPDGEIPTSFQDAAAAIENMAAELAELRARPTLTAEEVRNYLNEDRSVSADDWHAAYAKLRAIAEGASK